MDDPRDFCSHGDYTGGDARVCFELEADRAWLESLEEAASEQE
jgi:hypothetical protein